MTAFRAWFFDQLAMYTAYHRDRRNQLTHHIGVPLIIFAILLALTPVTVAQVGDTRITLAGVLLGILLLGYIAAQPLIGIVTAIFYAVVFALVEMVAVRSPENLWSIAIGGFVVGWIIQFIGHIFEGRRPAFTTNVVQLFVAALFLVAEVFFALGLMKDLEASLIARSAKYAAEPAPA